MDDYTKELIRIGGRMPGVEIENPPYSVKTENAPIFNGVKPGGRLIDLGVWKCLRAYNCGDELKAQQRVFSYEALKAMEGQTIPTKKIKCQCGQINEIGRSIFVHRSQ